MMSYRALAFRELHWLLLKAPLFKKGKDMKVERGKRMFLKIIIVVSIVFAVGVLMYNLRWTLWHYLYVRPWIADSDRQTMRMRVSLLCETDHEALLEACRELSRRAGRGDLKPGRYDVRSDRHSKVSQFPQPILELAPGYVYIDENDSNRVMVAMHGGLDHFGVEAYTEDYKKPSFVGFKFGDKELIPGLWYYDDGYDHNPLLYDKRIEELIKEHKGETFIKKLGTKKLR